MAGGAAFVFDDPHNGPLARRQQSFTDVMASRKLADSGGATFFLCSLHRRKMKIARPLHFSDSNCVSALKD